MNGIRVRGSLSGHTINTQFNFFVLYMTKRRFAGIAEYTEIGWSVMEVQVI